jgi:NADH-ubiquinone oxidoreductase chain 2
MYQSTFICTLILGTFIACSANSWFVCWLGLEINLIRLMPLLISKLNPLSTETAIKYFLAQAIASLIIIFSSLAGRRVTFSSIVGDKNEIIFVALRIKAGIAPFHFWFPQVIKSTEWAQAGLILTWQKIAPFTLLSRIAATPLMYPVIIFSAVTGLLGGLNQTNLKTILVYSSIAHSA